MAQDTTPSIIMYQGGTNTFPVPFDKGYYGEVKVLFVRRGATGYEYEPASSNYDVNGRLYAWGAGSNYIYTRTPTPAVGASIYNAQDVATGKTVASAAGQTITVSGTSYSRATQHDISNHLILTWKGTALSKNDYICIGRDTESGQPYSLPNNQKHIEGALDNIERQVQELKDKTDNALVVDPTHTIDASKMGPIDWLKTIVRSKDYSARGLRYVNGYLQYSLDDPEVPESQKSWTSLLNTENITTVREYYDKEKDIRYPEYSTDGGKTWKMLGLVHMINDLQGQIDDINEDKQSIHEDINGINSNVASLFNKTAVNASNINSLEQTDIGHNNRISTNEHDIADLKSTKLDKNQGKVHSGKTMMVDENGYIVPKASTEDSGLRAVSHDNSMDGAGTDEDPLRLAETISGNRTFKDDVKIKGNVEAETVVKTPKLNNGADISVPTVGGTLARTEDIDSKITNCITEIPQNVKLEFSGGKFTLKAGSKVYVPNGTGAFNTIDIKSDISITFTSHRKCFLYYYNGGLNFTDAIQNCVSGDTDPLAGQQWHTWYDTANNVIKRYTSDATTPAYTGISLPLALITISSSGTSIDEVFNGFGYIGSHVFVLPGVKGLISNGYNKDGTLHNGILRMTKPVVSLANSGVLGCGQYNAFGARPNYYIVDKYADMVEKNLAGFYYIKEINGCYSWGGGSAEKYFGYIPCGTVRVSGGKVQSIDINRPFRAVDYNDFESTVEEINSSISAVDSSVVHKTKNETIGGEKTFTSIIRMQGQYLHFDGIDSSATQSFKDIDAYDTTGKAVGGFRIEYSSTNGHSVSLIARKTDGTVGGNLGVRTKPDGTYSSFAPKPASTSNSTEIATTSWSNEKFLPLAGGTMSGVITRSGTHLAKRNVDNSYLELDGGTTYLNGAYLRLDGKDSGNSGQFRLATGDGSKNITLIGKPDGSLLWDELPVATTKAKSLAQKGYYMFSNGLIIQWGSVVKEGNKQRNVSFAVPFSSTNYKIVANLVTDGSTTAFYSVSVKSSSKTTTSCQLFTDGNANNWDVEWIAIGY